MHSVVRDNAQLSYPRVESNLVSISCSGLDTMPSLDTWLPSADCMGISFGMDLIMILRNV
jgi:hypothetical protein